MHQGDLIRRVGSAASGTGLFDGLFLAGSFGKGQADEWSDVDLLGLAPPDRHREIVSWWRAWLDEQESLIYFQTLERGGTLVNAITTSWLRADLSLIAPEQFGARSQDSVKPLYDPAGRYAGLPACLPKRQPDRGRVEWVTLEFIRILGLTPVVLARGELVTMVLGNGMLRDLMAQLMLEEVPIADRGGILHQSKLLPASDMQVLRNLPYPGPERDALIEGQLNVARIFFPRARAVGEQLDLAWPAAFETATRTHLAGFLGRQPETLWVIEP